MTAKKDSESERIRERFSWDERAVGGLRITPPPKKKGKPKK